MAVSEEQMCCFSLTAVECSLSVDDIICMILHAMFIFNLLLGHCCVRM